MFKGFKNTKAGPNFHGFPAKGFNMSQSAYGFSGVYAWLDAAYGLDTQVNLGAISSWIDKATGTIFSQSTAGNQPRYSATNGAFNNLPAVDFQDTDRFLTSLRGIQTYNSMTVAFVAQKSVANSRNILLTTSSVIESGNIRLGMGATLGQGIGVYNGDTILVSSGVNDTAPHIVVMSMGATGTAQIIIDGVQVATGSWTFSDAWRAIGVSGNGPHALLAEVLCFDSSMTQQQCVALSDNLNTKYAIY